ncbi:major facilitator superfamily domain-containing protein [Microdochium bolleyi]|uniref:Major facilitator superfamily domain-containing protein n=1 Tax=Microdochium bolleyi TaxID=196109 RepID=A0A136IVM0_9PEZI|nr:major facilitator superfamily domain-containing protein [Microdochium bolleyi]
MGAGPFPHIHPNTPCDARNGRPRLWSSSLRAARGAERRGLFASLLLVPEVQQSRDCSDRAKWFLTAIIAVASVLAPTVSSIFWPALPQLSEAFDAAPALVNLSVAFYMLSISIYVISFTLNMVFCVLSRFSVIMTMLIVSRTLAGGVSATVQAVGARSFADIWDSEERGPPIFSGTLTNAFGWQSTMWFLAAYGCSTTILILFGPPETLLRKKDKTPVPRADAAPTGDDGRPLSQVVSTMRPVREKTSDAGIWLRRIFIDPLSIMIYFRYPTVQCTIWCSAITVGGVYILNIGVQAALTKAPYSYSPWVIGLLYIPGSVGYVLSSIFGGMWLDRVIIRETVRQGRYDADGKLVVLPEDRIMLIFGAANTMLTEFMPGDSSSDIALNSFVRMLFTCAGLFSLLAGTCWVGIASCIWLLRKKGRGWRAAMDSATTR